MPTNNDKAVKLPVIKPKNHDRVLTIYPIPAFSILQPITVDKCYNCIKLSITSYFLSYYVVILVILYNMVLTMIV